MEAYDEETWKNYDSFNVTITCRHEDLGDGYKESMKNQIQKLSKFYANIIDANVTLDKQNSNYKVEILLHVPGSVISAKYEDFNHTKAFDSAIDKVKTQVKKLKSKVVDHRKSTLQSVIEPGESEEFEEFEE